MDRHTLYRLGPNKLAREHYQAFQVRLSDMMKERRAGSPVVSVAAEASVNPGTWRKAEAGKLDVHVSTLFKLCSMLSVKPESLFSP